MVNSVTPMPKPPIARDTMAKARWRVTAFGLAGLRVGVEVIGLLFERFWFMGDLISTKH
ncbi:hypothetical protein D3C84_1199640 [compost metagenome]